jgi:hypothetical protein
LSNNAGTKPCTSGLASAYRLDKDKKTAQVTAAAPDSNRDFFERLLFILPKKIQRMARPFHFL